MNRHKELYTKNIVSAHIWGDGESYIKNMFTPSLLAKPSLYKLSKFTTVVQIYPIRPTNIHFKK